MLARIEVSRDEIEAIFRRRGWLAQQPADFRGRLLARGRLMQVARGESVYHEGDEPGGIYGLVAGGIGVLVGPPKLSPRVAHVLRAGNWFGNGPILRGGARSLGFVALEPSNLLTIPLVTLQEIGQDDPETFRRIGDLSDQSVTVACGVSADLMIPWSDRRVAAVLLRVTAADEGVEPDHPNGFLLDQSQLAEMANVSRNLVNVAFGRFRDAGWATHRYNRVRVLDAEALAAFAYEEA
jgi:CRP/FNR family transcriptional regulator, cyclic AMP receptor protein